MEKKLEYIIDSLITPFLRDKYPIWEDFFKEYFKYLDQGIFGKIIKLTDNNNPFQMYSELLDDYLNTYFKDVIDIEKYGLTEQNKRIYLSLSKFIIGLRGNRNGFDFLFKSLTDFRFPLEGGDVEIDKIAVEYAEDESWWTTGNPYTYRFVLDQTYEVMKELIQSVHPAGFIFEFVTEHDFIDGSETIFDEISMKTIRIPEYNGEFNYDGTITYGGIELENITF